MVVVPVRDDKVHVNRDKYYICSPELTTYFQKKT